MKLFFSSSGSYPMAEPSACRAGHLLCVFGMFVARCQRCNPAMTDNVTARLSLRRSPDKEAGAERLET